MRLIDADALTKEIEDFNCKNCNHYNHVRCRACQIDDALSYIDDAPTVEDTNVPSKWISVKERLPETRHAVLVYTPHHKNIWAASMHEDGNWYIWSPGGKVLLDPDWHGPITHWMPLPEPPKEVKQND